jgi:predicted cupin superfamily sugar epimerase
MQENRILQLVEQLHLSPHPEGGYFKETYRSSEGIKAEQLPYRFTADRNFSTAIYFLMPGNTFSAFHRIASDEVWHFYDGDPIDIFVINEMGDLEILKLGNKLAEGQQFQHLVKAGNWFASQCAAVDGYSLVGCTVAPGFDFADFELANKATLLQEFPQHAFWIQKLCR